MFIVLLRFSEHKPKAPQFMEAHKAWLQRGFEEGAFLLAGSLQPSQGGGIIALGGSRADVERRVAEDPFVAENVVTAEVLELHPSRMDPRLAPVFGV